MITRTLKPSAAVLAEAAALIRAGALVGFPTETVYGLGANALDSDAVAAIFAAKGRPGDNPLIAHIAQLEQLSPLISGEPSPAARALMDAFWPGPLTLIFPKSVAVPRRTTAGLDTVAIRMPSHPVAQALILRCGLPIAAPSGNRSGRPSPTTAAHMLEDMDGRVPLIIDGGSCGVGVESTVVDVTGEVPRVLRPGGVTPEQIEAVCGACEVDPSVMRPLGEGEKPRSPGMKYRHYAPAGELTIYRGAPEAVAAAICAAYDRAESERNRALILAMDANLPRYGERRARSLGQDAKQAAKRLFAALREADALRADVILAEAVDDAGIGLAVMNRMGRAAAFHIVDVEGGDAHAAQ